MAAKPPRIRQHHRQIFVCTDGDCAKKSDAKKVLKRFKKELAKARKKEGIDRALCNTMNCVKVCKKGPLVVVWPDGIWYHSVDKKALKRIVDEHIIGGQPVEKYMFHRIPGAEYKPADE